ncbi:MAG: STAS domain-containing protein [Terracidiphilus sp.]
MTSAFMTNAICEEMAPLTMSAVDTTDAGEPVRGQIVQGQLVRGQDAVLLEHMSPLVRKCNVALDLSSVKRIDASGIAALVALYQSARESGHSFSLINVPARVAQILTVVGLDRFLLSHNAVQSSQYGQQVRRPAA